LLGNKRFLAGFAPFQEAEAVVELKVSPSLTKVMILQKWAAMFHGIHKSLS